MTRTKSTERIHLSYERVVEHESDDGSDPHPSFPPTKVTFDTDGEPVNDWRPLVKCKAPTRARKVG